MGLGADLERIAGLAASHGEVTGVLAAEPTRGRRFYLVAFGPDSTHRWLVLNGDGQVVDRRGDVREVASIVGMCELAAELAGGGDLEELRAKLTQTKIVEQPPGIEEAEAAALALERVVGAPPRVAAPAYLDEVGAATIVLERALGEVSSPFAEALRSNTGTVEAFVGDVERGYLVDLR